MVLPGTLAAQDPLSPHGKLSNRVDCSACHTGDAWTPTRDPLDFDHDRQTGFALGGAHAEAECSTCHLSLRFDQPEGPGGGECSTCHVDVHRGSLGSDCASCHNNESFTSAPSLDQHALTRFPLTGGHEHVGCESCHLDDQGGQFSPLDTDCVSCHEADYRATQLVDHVASGFPTDCLQCHSVQAWRLAPVFDHAAASNGFELLGAHDQVGCEGCHIRPGNELRYHPSGESDCVACHRTDYDREHQGSNFPTDCLQCHNRSTWDDADFDHSLSSFPLVGAHVSLDCSECHGSANALLFRTPATPSDCVACHQKDYDGQHRGSGFATTCLDCHTTSTWDGADFDHSQSRFPLVGAHVTLGCNQCHGSGNVLLFQTPSTPSDCVACHQKDYNRQHQGSGFSTTCLDCHTTSRWEGATFNHSQYFPITSGGHRGTVCSDCHTVPTDKRVFTCLSCHEHRQSKVDGDHRGVSGYVYQSDACYACHPNGKGD